MIDNTHVVVLRGSGREMVPGAGDGRLWRAFGLSVRGARDWECEPFRARRAPLISLVIGYAQLTVESWPKMVILNGNTTKMKPGYFA